MEKPKDGLALRYNKGKRKWSLVDFEALEPLVEVLEYGAEKYSAHNWKRGHPTTELIDSLMRHLVEFSKGKDYDEESGCPLVGHIMANAMFLSYVMNNKPELDDRYKEEIN